MKKKSNISGKADNNHVFLKEVIRLFDKRDLIRIGIVAAVQIFMGLLDLLGVALIGVLSALAINGIQSRPPGNRVTQILSFLHISEQSLQVQTTILGLVAAGLLIFKTFVSIYFTRRTLFFLGRRSATMTRNLLGQLYSKSILEIKSMANQDFLYAITTGMNAMIVGVTGTLVLLIADFSTVLILTAGLFVLDPRVALLSVGLFSSLGGILYILLRKRALRLGETQAALSVANSEQILQSLLSYRELLVHDRRDFMVENISKQRMLLSDTAAEMSFLPSVSKYVIEISIVIGAISVSAFQFLTTDSARAISILSVFLAASTRLAPAILRIQQGSTSIKANLAFSTRTMTLVRKYGIQARELRSSSRKLSDYQGFVPEIELENITFKFPDQDIQTINRLSLKIPSGSLVALVGPSGAGKSTLTDLILGVIEPNSGSARISGLDPLSAIKRWPGSISYVPQEVHLSNGTILENVTFGYEPGTYSNEEVLEVIHKAQLEEFVSTLPDGLNTHIGDRGTRLSGGQRQRIGLARALFSRPKLLILDEATSSLDGETEANFSQTLEKMRGDITIILVAHRLATVRNADNIYYIENGFLKAQGNFEELKTIVPNFAKQAKLHGL